MSERARRQPISALDRSPEGEGVDDCAAVSPSHRAELIARFERVTGSRLIKFFAPALLDQAMLPEISAALESTGRIAHAPWQRALATAASAQIITAGDVNDRTTESQRLLRLHRDIRGVSPTGLRYSALTPRSWHWVLISTFGMQLATYTALTGHHPNTAETQALWQHYRAKTAGLQLPGRPALASDYLEIRAHYDQMVRKTLARTPTLHTATEILLHRAPPPPFLPSIAGPLWQMIRPFIGQLAALPGIAIMHPGARALVPMTWGPYRHTTAVLFIRLLRLLFRVVPRAITDSPLARNRRRYRALISRYRQQTATGSPARPRRRQKHETEHQHD
ncbi:oxygenase MpaB family protein [Nocardia goodfellowii]